MKGNDGTYTADLVAKLLNITPRRLQQLARDGVVPKANRGAYPLAGCVRGYVMYLQGIGGHDGQPEKMDPFKRKAHYQAELARLTFETNGGQLIPAAEVEAEYSELVKSQVQFLDTLPDSLERDCSLTPEQVDAMHQSIDRQRQILFDRLVSDEGVTEATG